MELVRDDCSTNNLDGKKKCLHGNSRSGHRHLGSRATCATCQSALLTASLQLIINRCFCVSSRFIAAVLRMVTFFWGHGILTPAGVPIATSPAAALWTLDEAPSGTSMAVSWLLAFLPRFSLRAFLSLVFLIALVTRFFCFTASVFRLLPALAFLCTISGGLDQCGIRHASGPHKLHGPRGQYGSAAVSQQGKGTLVYPA